MSKSNKKIICIEGLDGVGKTTLLENWKQYFTGTTNPITNYLINPNNIIFEHFPTDGSEARRIRKTETNIDEVKLQQLMLEDIIQRVDKFFNEDKEEIMICDRFLFSNFVYSFGMTISEFTTKVHEVWDDYNLPMFEIFVMNNLKTIVLEIPENIRLSRIFNGRSESERDSNETETYQNELYDRYDKLMHSPARQFLEEKFNITVYYPKDKSFSLNMPKKSGGKKK